MVVTQTLIDFGIFSSWWLSLSPLETQVASSRCDGSLDCRSAEDRHALAVGASAAAHAPGLIFLNYSLTMMMFGPLFCFNVKPKSLPTDL